jgi:hypothetical protein
MHFADLEPRQKLAGGVELAGFGQMGDIAGVEREGGACGRALTASMVRFSVPMTSGLASLLKPIWVSLICRNSGVPMSVRASAMSKALNTPPDRVKSVPAPTPRHLRASRREVVSVMGKSPDFARGDFRVRAFIPARRAPGR